MNLKGRDFLKLLDFSAEEIRELLDYSAQLKEMKKKVVFSYINGIKLCWV